MTPADRVVTAESLTDDELLDELAISPGYVRWSAFQAKRRTDSNAKLMGDRRLLVLMVQATRMCGADTRAARPEVAREVTIVINRWGPEEDDYGSCFAEFMALIRFIARAPRSQGLDSNALRVLKVRLIWLLYGTQMSEDEARAVKSDWAGALALLDQ